MKVGDTVRYATQGGVPIQGATHPIRVGNLARVVEISPSENWVSIQFADGFRHKAISSWGEFVEPMGGPW